MRVEDAALVDEGGPARLAISRLDRADKVAEAVASASGVVSAVEDRLVVTVVPSRLVHAAGRVGGSSLADPLETAITRAIDGWLGFPPEVPTPAGVLRPAQDPVVMGIVNVTPDSFSDGGEFYRATDHPKIAIERGRELAAAGAQVIDVGGESTRPGADPVSESDELDRVLPVIEALAGDGLVVSIDTTKAAVARAAVEAGAGMVNDVSAGAFDGLLLPTVVELGIPYVIMHMRGTPRTMQRDPRYRDVVGEVFDFLADTVDRVTVAGADPAHLIIDPGIGFGKTMLHNLELLRRAREFTSLGRALLIGTSRKSFLGTLTGRDDPALRVEGSIVTAAMAVAAGAAMVRVHDVAETVRAVRVAHAVATGRIVTDAVDDEPDH